MRYAIILVFICLGSLLLYDAAYVTWFTLSGSVERSMVHSDLDYAKAFAKHLGGFEIVSISIEFYLGCLSVVAAVCLAFRPKSNPSDHTTFD